MKKLRTDFKELFVDWGKYYTLPLHWTAKQCVSFASLLSMVVISAYVDEPIRYFFFTIHGTSMDGLARVVHWFGTGYPTLYLLLILYVGGLALNSDKIRLGGVMLLQAYLYSGVITNVLKSAVGRWRPNAGHGHLTFSPFSIAPNAHLSFPSGDVAVVFSLSIVMAGLLHADEDSASMQRNAIRIWQALWIMLALLTSLS